MSYVDLTDVLTACDEHQRFRCWECLAAHHIDETSKLTLRVKELKTVAQGLLTSCALGRDGIDYQDLVDEITPKIKG